VGIKTKNQGIGGKIEGKMVNYNIWKPPPRGLFVLTKIFYYHQKT